MAVFNGTGGNDNISNTTTPSIFQVQYVDINGATNNLEARTLSTYFDITDGSIAVSNGDTAPSGASILVNPFGTADSNLIDPETQALNNANGGIGFNDFSGHAMQFETLLHTEGGTYTFDATFFNSAALYIDGTQVFFSENANAGTASGTIALAEGAHEVVIIYAKDIQGGNADDLNIDISGGEFGVGGQPLEGTGAVGPLVGDDTVNAGDGADTVDASFGDDSVSGGGGDDELSGGGGADTIDGGTGSDTVDGGDGDDSITGGGDGDELSGGSGSDTIDGGAGTDTITGGDGDDTFIFDPTGTDVITDFNAGNTGAIDDGDQTNNDFVDLSPFYTELSKLQADFDDDGLLNHSTGGDGAASAITGSLELQGVASSDELTTDNTNVTICFTRTMKLMTRKGDVAVEDLKIGDELLTVDHGYQPIRFIHSSRVVAEGDMVPVCFEPGILGNKDRVIVSQQHRFLAQELPARIRARLRIDGDYLIKALYLVNGKSIRLAAEMDTVEYYHLMLDRHELVYCDGTISESWQPHQRNLKRDKALHDELLRIFPEIATKTNKNSGAWVRREIGPGHPAPAMSR